ncbi:MAG: hypothetical protein ACRDJN_13165 [Chloroflexota bacterium]
MASVLELLRRLPVRDRLWVVAQVLPDVERDLPQVGPTESLLGLCADLGPAPSAEDIAEARREMWRDSSGMDA